MLTNLLNKDGSLRILTCSEYEQFTQDELRLFCHLMGRYCLPTAELVTFLKQMIDPDTTLEIGAGAGDLGRALGIRMTDNHMQTWSDVKAIYTIQGQPTVPYGPDVEQMDALEAIARYKPHTVLGAWVTQWIDPNQPPPSEGGNMYGIREEELLERVKRYIVIGAEGIHGRKKILRHPHRVIDAPFARSRRTDNKIWIWEKP